MAQQRFFYPDEAKGGQERAVLVGTVLPGSDRDDEEENLLELARLARAAGARVLHALMQERSAPDVSTYIGKGKVEELAELCREREANLIIVDNELSPVQARNLEKRTDTNVCDRTELILDIFARRARTRQARLQVELAQLEYLRPRLRRMWEHLSRQAGGIGTRGPGETQLEVDRRRLGDRMAQLKRELEKVARVSETKARQRRRRAFSVALVLITTKSPGRRKAGKLRKSLCVTVSSDRLDTISRTSSRARPRASGGSAASSSAGSLKSSEARLTGRSQHSSAEAEMRVSSADTAGIIPPNARIS